MSPHLPSPAPSPVRSETPPYGTEDFPSDPPAWWQRLARHLLRPWHLFRIWALTRQIRRQRRELAKYVRRSAYEIAAWKQDIRFIADRREYHQHHSRLHREPSPPEFKVVPLPTASSEATTDQK